METVTNEQLYAEVKKLSVGIPNVFAEEMKAVNEKVDLAIKNQAKHQDIDNQHQEANTNQFKGINDKFTAGENTFKRIEAKIDKLVESAKATHNDLNGDGEHYQGLKQDVKDLKDLKENMRVEAKVKNKYIIAFGIIGTVFGFIGTGFAIWEAIKH